MTDLFTSTTTEPITNTIDPNTSLYETLVGDGKKFKTNEDLAKAKMESDRFIQQLQNELQGLRTDLSARSTLEQLMDKLNAPKDPPTNQQHNQGSMDGDGQNGAKSFSEEDIARLVEDRLSKAEKARVHNANLETVKNALVASFGNDYVTHLKAKAAELGMSEEYLQNLAKETPKAFLKLVEANGESRATPVANGLFTPPQGSHTPANNASKGFSPTGIPKMSYYENLKKQDPTKYWSPEVQNKMHKDALSLGADFFDV